MNISVDRKKSVCFSNNFISKRCQKYIEKYFESEKEKVDKFQFARERYGEWMRILHEFSWLWETLVIALAAAAVCVVCAMLICKIVKRDISKKNSGSYRRSSICGRCFGSHNDCPDSDAALIKRDWWFPQPHYDNLFGKKDGRVSIRLRHWRKLVSFFVK